MADVPNPKRSYDSPRRREQAAATRRDILEAAQRLFERRGYATTKMADIATEAGVALKTVYSAFETKSGVLRALWNVLLRGDDADVPVEQREWYREVIEEPDPERQLRLNARNARAVKERIAGVLEVIRQAALVDADSEALWERIQSDSAGAARELEHLLARPRSRRGEHCGRDDRPARIHVLRVPLPSAGHGDPHATQVRAQLIRPVDDASGFHDIPPESRCSQLSSR